MNNIKLTELEKQVLRNALSEGFAFDDEDDPFITWGPIEGHRERGAVSSLIKKNIINVEECDGDVWVVCADGVTISDIIEMSDYK